VDTNLQVAIFGEHCQHIRELSAGLEAILHQFTLAHCEPAGAATVDAARLLGEMRHLNNSLFSVADIFHQRLGMFIETWENGK